VIRPVELRGLGCVDSYGWNDFVFFDGSVTVMFVVNFEEGCGSILLFLLQVSIVEFLAVLCVSLFSVCC